MPKYEIKTVVTGADQAAKDLSKPGKAIDDITAKLKAMDEAEQKALKTQRVHGDESQQMASHLSKLTQETKAQGATVEKVTGIKGKWLGAIKNLKHEIPGLGYALGALKNPFVAIIWRPHPAEASRPFERWLTPELHDLRRAISESVLTTPPSDASPQ